MESGWNILLTCACSQVFYTAFSSEGSTQSYQLLETSKGAVAFLVQYLYTGKIQAAQLRTIYDDDMVNAVEEDADMVRLWVLADMLHIPKLQNLTLNIIHEIEHKTNQVALRALWEVYRLTETGSLLRRYYVESCTLYMDSAKFTEQRDRLPYEMLLETTVFLSERLTILMDGVHEDLDLDISDYFVSELQD